MAAHREAGNQRSEIGKGMKLPTRKAVAIIADGPSASPFRHFDIPQEVYVIAVNHASIWLPRCNAYFTAVPDHRQRFLMNHQRQGVRYFAAVPDHYGSLLVADASRGPRERNVTFMRRVLDTGATCSKAPFISAGKQNGPINSAFGALNLAYHLGAERVALIGVDLNDRPRVSGGRATGLAGVVDLFDHYDAPHTVVNGAPHSPIRAFPKMTAIEAIQWLL